MLNKLCSRTSECPLERGTYDREVEGNTLPQYSVRLAEAAGRVGTRWTLEQSYTALRGIVQACGGRFGPLRR